jgi:hypothetical protein
MSGSRAAPLAVVTALLALAAIPAAVAVSWGVKGVGLLRAIEIAVPLAFLLGLVAVACVRRARFRIDRTVARRGESRVRAARMVAFAALYLAACAAIALGFYGLLVVRGG